MPNITRVPFALDCRATSGETTSQGASPSSARDHVTGLRLYALLAMIAAEPVEDGVVHPAETTLSSFMKHSGSRLIQQWLTQGISSEPSGSAALLRLLGRCSEIEAQFQAWLLDRALSSPSVDLRDAAVQAAESWGNPGLVSLLVRHEEAVPWLARYQASVIQELER